MPPCTPHPPNETLRLSVQIEEMRVVYPFYDARVVFCLHYDLQGTHISLKDNTKAKATVGAIIDGMGSLGKVQYTFVHVQFIPMCN